MHWFNVNRSSFAVPIILREITADGVGLRFPNHPDCLSAWLSRNELNVHVKWQGQCWDTLVSLDGFIDHVPDGYKCSLCVHEHGEAAKLFSNREALWLDHLFDPFLNWVNEELAPARWLQISGIKDGGATWAQLIQDESALHKPDRTLLLMQQLKRIDGTPAYEGGAEGVTNWLVELRPENDCYHSSQ